MKTVAAIQTATKAKLELVELELPDPGPDQVTVKVLSSGVCHSQLHQMHNPALARPLLLGHEGTGVVLKAGANVTHVKEGDRCIFDLGAEGTYPRATQLATNRCAL